MITLTVQFGSEIVRYTGTESDIARDVHSGTYEGEINGESIFVTVDWNKVTIAPR